MRGWALGVGGAAIAIACSSSYSGEEETALPERDAGGADVGRPLQCGDPGSECVVVPSGWFLVVGLGGGDAGAEKPTCPPYFTDPRVLLENPRVEGTKCTCDCGAPTTNSCASGTLAVHVKAFGMACDNATVGVAVNGEGCAALPNGANYINGAQAAPLAPAAVACGPVKTAPPAVVTDSRLAVCTSPAPTPCSDGACVAVPNDAQACFLRDGEQDCPAGTTSRRIVVSASEINDSRKCGACTCNATAASCSNARIDMFPDAACGGTPTTLPIDNVCHALPNVNFSKFEYRVTANGATCAVVGDAPAVSGTIALPTAKKTLCCR